MIQIAHFLQFFATSKNTAPLLSILVWILVGLMTRWFILKIEGNISIVLHEKKIDSVLSKDSEIETQKRCRVFFEKEEVLMQAYFFTIFPANPANGFAGTLS